MKKTPVKPIAVSQVNPVYIDDRIKYWHVDVRFAGDLAMWHNEDQLPKTVQEYKQYLLEHGFTEQDIENMEGQDGEHVSLGKRFYKFKQDLDAAYDIEKSFVLNPRLDIPKSGKISTVRWDEKSKEGDNKYANTLVGYMFRDGLFGRGAERAWQFRIKMMAEITRQKKEENGR